MCAKIKFISATYSNLIKRPLVKSIFTLLFLLIITTIINKWVFKLFLPTIKEYDINPVFLISWTIVVLVSILLTIYNYENIQSYSSRTRGSAENEIILREIINTKVQIRVFFSIFSLLIIIFSFFGLNEYGQIKKKTEKKVDEYISQSANNEIEKTIQKIINQSDDIQVTIKNAVDDYFKKPTIIDIIDSMLTNNITPKLDSLIKEKFGSQEYSNKIATIVAEEIDNAIKKEADKIDKQLNDQINDLKKRLEETSKVLKDLNKNSAIVVQHICNAILADDSIKSTLFKEVDNKKVRKLYEYLKRNK